MKNNLLCFINLNLIFDKVWNPSISTPFKSVNKRDFYLLILGITTCLLSALGIYLFLRIRSLTIALMVLDKSQLAMSLTIPSFEYHLPTTAISSIHYFEDISNWFSTLESYIIVELIFIIALILICMLIYVVQSRKQKFASNVSLLINDGDSTFKLFWYSLPYKSNLFNITVIKPTDCAVFTSAHVHSLCSKCTVEVHNVVVSLQMKSLGYTNDIPNKKK